MNLIKNAYDSPAAFFTGSLISGLSDIFLRFRFGNAEKPKYRFEPRQEAILLFFLV